MKKLTVLLILSFVFYLELSAQYCDSYGHNNTWEWISGVKINNINNTSGKDPNAYGDYTSIIDTLFLGGTYQIAVSFGGGYAEYIAVWIDFNANSVFETSERIVAEFGNDSITASLSVQPSAVNGNTRMRVIMNYNAQTTDPCIDSLPYGETEDYSIILAPNTSPPQADFIAGKTISCTGSLTVQFTDNSQFVPTSWFWDFGDGNTDTIQNPAHLYASDGSYEVTLVAVNSFGSDTINKKNFINVSSGGPIAASCAPVTLFNYGGIGIYNVTFDSINNTTPDGIDSYQDYVCNYSTTVIAGVPYTVTVKTGPTYKENVRIWVDYDNDGNFNDTTELLFKSDKTLLTHTGVVMLPGTTVYDTSLRMRVSSDYPSTPTPCTNINAGQAEDYAITIIKNNNPPVADFTTFDTLSCQGILVAKFTDLSQNVPASWFWDFGDGTTDTVQNPTHTYGSDSTYTITLIVNNIFGTDTIVKSNLIKLTSDGPVLASCFPVTTGYFGGMGIYNLTLDSINNTTLDGVDGYKDYSCNLRTTLTAGVPYNIAVTTGPNYKETVRVWVDFNSDGVFSDTLDLVFKSDDVLANHFGTIILPGSVLYNTSLRMRVASDYFGSSDPAPCNNVTYGQVEDYSLIILENFNPPVAGFRENNTSGCQGSLTVQFKDSSLNVPDSWFWDFGDGTTDTVQNPNHTYTSDGSYSVTLIASNSYGIDTIIKTNIVMLTSDGPVMASCAPVTTGYWGAMGIFNVTLDSINNTTSDGADSYKNYVCSDRTTLMAGVPYNISVKTGTSYRENVRAWIDYNGDGVFNDTLEMIFSSNNILTNHSGTVMLPGTVLYDTSLRMRVASDYYGYAVPAPCNNVIAGQVEDYSIIIIENTNPPVADFVADNTLGCQGTLTVVFKDISLNLPNKWFWDFGDGATDTVQNPTHSYTATDSTFTVTLIVTSDYGTDTIIKTAYINLNSYGPLSASCTPTTTGYFGGMGIYSVKYNTLSNTTPDGKEGYKDYTCSKQTTVMAGITYNIFVRTGSTYEENVRVWIDYNNDGVFDNATENVFTSDVKLVNHNGTVTAPGNAVYNTSLRMRVSSDYWGNVAPTPCSNVTYGQVEDYSVTVIPNPYPPVSGFVADKTLTCDGMVNFTDLSTNLPSSWFWNFGDGSTSTLQNPSHSYPNSVAQYTVTLISCNSNGCDTIIYVDYITKGKSPVTASCKPTSSVTKSGVGIMNVSLNTINNNSLDAKTEGYVDFTCSGFSTDLIAEATYKIKITTGSVYKENVRVWIDYNSNGFFDNSTELAFSSNNVYLYHIGNITIPANAIKDSVLRMRVASAEYTKPVPVSCGTITDGQAEDYSVYVISNTVPPVVNFEFDSPDPCSGTVNFTDASINNASVWNWNFGDGVGSSSLQNPDYTYAKPGNYNVVLIATNTYGNDTVNKSVKVSFTYADFSVTGDSNMALFTNKSVEADSAIWYFGDDSSSLDMHPFHKYDSTGVYQVTLIAYNYKGCIDTLTREIIVNPNSTFISGQSTMSVHRLFSVYPNPAMSYIVLKYYLDKPDNIRISLTNLLGQEIYTCRILNTANLEQQIDVSSYDRGIYILKVQYSTHQNIGKIVLQ